MKKAQALESHIADNFASQAEFARAQGVKRPQVTQWIKSGFIVVDGELYSHRRELKLV
jgi:predicted XRE-type DNA-binding protein